MNFFRRFILYILFFVSIVPAGNYVVKAQTADTTFVGKYGQLAVHGNKIVDKNGNPVALRGMSLFWSQFQEGSKYYNYDVVKWLRDDWKCSVVRAAMGIEFGGYLSNPTREKARIKTVIDACVDLGIYVIVDWHDHNAHNHLSQSVQFFQEIAAEYKDKPNILYEIYNEPLNTASWLNDVRPYADSVIKSIRVYDPDNIVLVGSPTWSQDVDIATANPVPFPNIAYTLHFYAATHKQELRAKATTALNRGYALFVSEWGTCEASGTGIIDNNSVTAWSTFMDANKLSWCNWSIADKNETSAALKAGASATGGWDASMLSTSGALVRSKIIAYNDTVLTGVEDYTVQPAQFKLGQNYPNPFNPSTNIEYGINIDAFVKLHIYDVKGELIKTLINEYQPSGNYKIEWNGYTDKGGKASSGVYLFSLQVNNRVQSVKGILLN